MHPPTAPVPCSSAKRANKTSLVRVEKGSPRTDPVYFGKRVSSQVMHWTSLHLHFCADGELRAVQPYSLCRARAESGAALGAGGDKTMAKALAAAHAAHLSAVPSSSPTLSLFLTSSGSRGTWQRDAAPAADSRPCRHTLAFFFLCSRFPVMVLTRDGQSSAHAKVGQRQLFSATPEGQTPSRVIPLQSASLHSSHLVPILPQSC